MNIKCILILSVMSLLSGCSIATLQSSQSLIKESQAQLISYSLDERYVYIDVVSHGCTMMNSFELRLVSEQANSFEIIRKKPDSCRVKPIRMSLNYPFRHLGLDTNRPITLVNNISIQTIASF
ncbi:MAG: hypothetical protein KUG78_02140 [Kangiellaceae bacterium]|nr:hypothetical protein [Kangiellaceae bacterium]